MDFESPFGRGHVVVVHHVGEHLNGAGVVEDVGAHEEDNGDLVDLFGGGLNMGSLLKMFYGKLLCICTTMQETDSPTHRYGGIRLQK